MCPLPQTVFAPAAQEPQSFALAPSLLLSTSWTLAGPLLMGQGAGACVREPDVGRAQDWLRALVGGGLLT